MLNLYILFAVIVVLFMAVYFIASRKNNINEELLKVLGVALFIATAATIYFNREIAGAIEYEGVFPKGQLILLTLIEWVTTGLTFVTIICSFCKSKYLKKLIPLGPIAVILNLLLLQYVFVAWYGWDAIDDLSFLSNHRTYGFIFQLGLLFVTSTIFTIDRIKKKDFQFKYSVKEGLELLTTVLVVILVSMPMYALQLMFGTSEVAEDFNKQHILYGVIILAYFIAGMTVMRKKEYYQKKNYLLLCSFQALYYFYYPFREGLNYLPFQLCNMGVLLVFIALVFNRKSVFYFTYFANTLGCIVALINVTSGSGALEVFGLHYFVCHFHVLVIPIVGISIGVVPRARMRNMAKALIIFVIYFIFVAILNAWFNNYEYVDYFFLTGDQITDIFPFLINIKANYIYELPIGNLTFRFFWLYQLIVLISYSFFMSIMWWFFEYMHETKLELKNLMTLRKESNQLYIQLKKEFNGQPMNEPLEKEAIKMIKIENFSKKYAGSDRFSVKDLNLEIKAGEVFGFLGHNGAGKSTTIKSIVGIQSITQGRIIIDGYDISKQPIEAKLRVGYVSDNHAVYEKLTGREYINYVADLYLVPVEEREERIAKYTKMFNLVDAIDREIKGYSHGMKQKLVVIASLIHNPKVWVLDEPLTGLDPTSAFQIKECMREHANNGNIVFFSSHVIEVVEKICDKICIIARGNLVGIYDLKEMAAQGITLEQLYMQHVANANYNIDAPDAIKQFEDKKANE